MTAHITVVFVIIDKVIHLGFTVKWLTFLSGKQSIKTAVQSLTDYIFPYLDHTFFIMGMKKMMSRIKTYEHIGIKDHLKIQNIFHKF
jgi:hypothetical protein